MWKNQKSLLREVEIPEFPWYTIEKRIKCLRKVEIWEWTYCVKPEDPPDD